jgi:hypothetical protein
VTGECLEVFFFETLGMVGNLKEIHHSEYLNTDIIILKWILENRMERRGVNCSGEDRNDGRALVNAVINFWVP